MVTWGTRLVVGDAACSPTLLRTGVETVFLRRVWIMFMFSSDVMLREACARVSVGVWVGRGAEARRAEGRGVGGAGGATTHASSFALPWLYIGCFLMGERPKARQVGTTKAAQ